MADKDGAEIPGPNAWEQLGLEPALLAAVRRAGFDAPTDIQREIIPLALQGRDVLGQARTGTGKTAAFALPTLQRLTPGAGLQALVLVPTRELATQVHEHVQRLAVEKPVRTVVVLGGRRMKEQIARLRRNPELVIGTPGRVLDLMRRGLLDLAGVRIAILDEVDRMLDIGFRDDIRQILKEITAPHQTIFVSATIDEEIRKLARTFMREPAEVNVSGDMLTVESIRHGFVSVHPDDKFDTLLALLRHEQPKLAIVFTNTRHAARRIAQRLRKAGVNCREIHGDLVQSRRDRVMASFREQRTQVLVATDLLSRGLDVMEITHIVNYDVPEDPSAYVHRIGRTARMGQTGYAVTFVTPEEGKVLTEIEKLINREIEKFDAPWLVKRTAPAPPEATPAPPASFSTPPPLVVPSRLLQARLRDQTLEAYGLRPVPRTLGSRFRSPRRFRR
jgi:ATP-dependent RNA helicase DeaD